MSINVSLENSRAANDAGLALGAFSSIARVGARDLLEVVHLGRSHLIAARRLFGSTCGVARWMICERVNDG